MNNLIWLKFHCLRWIYFVEPQRIIRIVPILYVCFFGICAIIGSIELVYRRKFPHRIEERTNTEPNQTNLPFLIAQPIRQLNFSRFAYCLLKQMQTNWKRCMTAEHTEFEEDQKTQQQQQQYIYPKKKNKSRLDRMNQIKRRAKSNSKNALSSMCVYRENDLCDSFFSVALSLSCWFFSISFLSLFGLYVACSFALCVLIVSAPKQMCAAVLWVDRLNYSIFLCVSLVSILCGSRLLSVVVFLLLVHLHDKQHKKVFCGPLLPLIWTDV